MITDTNLDRMLRSLLREPAATPTAGLKRALAEVATVPQRRHGWLRLPGLDVVRANLQIIRFAAAVLVVILGGVLLGAQPLMRPVEKVPGAASGSEPPPATSIEPADNARCSGEGFQPAIDLEPDTLYGLGIGPIGFSVPSSGWTLHPSNDDGWTIERGPCIHHPGGWEVASTTITFGRSADGIYEDPCTQERADPFDAQTRDVGAGFDKRQQRADLAAAVAAIPGIEVSEAPSEFDLPNGFGAMAAAHVAVVVPEGPCRGFPHGSPLLYDRDRGDPEIRALMGPRDRVSLWIVDYTGHAGFPDWRFWIEAQASSTDMDDEINAIIASVQPLGG